VPTINKKLMPQGKQNCGSVLFTGLSKEGFVDWREFF
jgi:hypothetical protein